MTKKTNSAPTEQAIETVHYCLEQLQKSSDIHSLQENSYLCWAAKEILNRLNENKNIPPLVIIEEFQGHVAMYATLKPQYGNMFLTAEKMADWIINLLIA